MTPKLPKLGQGPKWHVLLTESQCSAVGRQAKAETTTPAPASREKGQRVHTPMYKKVQRQLHKQMKRMSKFFSRGPEYPGGRALSLALGSP